MTAPNFDPGSERRPIDWTGPEETMDDEARPAWLKEHSAWIKEWAARARARVDEALKPLTERKDEEL